MHDQQIIELIRANKSDKALNVLYKYYPMMRKMIRSKGGTAQDAEDIFQESLIILCRKATAPQFTLTAQLSTYLYSVCSYLWKDELKRRAHAPSAEMETGLEKPVENDLERILEDERKAKLAEKVLNEIGDRCRELLLLFYKTEMKLKEIAAHMGYSSENVAKNQKYKCLEGAKSRLKELKQISQTI